MRREIGVLSLIRFGFREATGIAVGNARPSYHRYSMLRAVLNNCTPIYRSHGVSHAPAGSQRRRSLARSASSLCSTSSNWVP